MIAINFTTSIKAIRRRACRLLALAGWGNVAALGLFGLVEGGSDIDIAILIAAIVSILPTVLGLRDKPSPAAPLVLAFAWAVYPALFVFIMKGQPWQMDLHMYFFVCLAALALLHDWRAIMLNAAIVAVHHTILLLVMPDWVFTGEGNGGRVILHVALVLMQCAALIFLIVQNIRRAQQQWRAQLQAEDAAQEAQDAKGEAERALAALHRSQAATDAAHRRQAELEIAALAAEEKRRGEIALLIERGLAGFVSELNQATRNITECKAQLIAVSRRAVMQSSDLQQTGDVAMTHMAQMATIADQLSDSFDDVAQNTRSASELSHAADGVSQRMGPEISSLHQEVEAARDILDRISEIATNSNLLALNATIEAARSGAAGSGFAVVAQEMKTMAKQTSALTDDIAERLANIRAASSRVGDTIEETSAAVTHISARATAIAVAVTQQGIAIATMADTARTVASRIRETMDIGHDLDGAVQESGRAAELTGTIATTLSHHSEGLAREMDRLLASLKAA